MRSSGVSRSLPAVIESVAGRVRKDRTYLMVPTTWTANPSWSVIVAAGGQKNSHEYRLPDVLDDHQHAPGSPSLHLVSTPLPHVDPRILHQRVRMQKRCDIGLTGGREEMPDLRTVYLGRYRVGSIYTSSQITWMSLIWDRLTDVDMQRCEGISSSHVLPSVRQCWSQRERNSNSPRIESRPDRSLLSPPSWPNIHSSSRPGTYVAPHRVGVSPPRDPASRGREGDANLSGRHPDLGSPPTLIGDRGVSLEDRATTQWTRWG